MRITTDTKAAKLAHYANREPREFRQFDAFKCSGWDDVIRPDEHGIGVTGGSTIELMTGAPIVRVLVTDDAAASDVAHALARVLEWVQSGGLVALDDCGSDIGVGGHKIPSQERSAALRRAIELIHDEPQRVTDTFGDLPF